MRSLQKSLNHASCTITQDVLLRHRPQYSCHSGSQNGRTVLRKIGFMFVILGFVPESVTTGCTCTASYKPTLHPVSFSYTFPCFSGISHCPPHLSLFKYLRVESQRTHKHTLLINCIFSAVPKI